jgi:WD40 repeat protein
VILAAAGIAAARLLGSGGPATFVATQPGESAVSVAFDPRGTLLAGGDANGHVYLWNIATGRQVANLATGGADVNSVAFSPDGTMLAAGDYIGSTYLWNVASGRLIATLADPAQGNPGSPQVNSVAFSPDGATLAVGDAVSGTYVWDVNTRNITATLTQPDGSGVAAAVFSPTGEQVAIGDWIGQNTYVWNTATRHVIATLGTGSYLVDDVAFSPDGKMVAVAGGNGTIYLYHVP